MPLSVFLGDKLVVVVFLTFVGLSLIFEICAQLIIYE